MAPGIESLNVLKYKMPTRRLPGLRNHLLTVTNGTAILQTTFSGFKPECRELSIRENGSLTAHETGTATAYALENFQSRETFIVKPGDEVYEGQVVGVHNRDSISELTSARRSI